MVWPHPCYRVIGFWPSLGRLGHRDGGRPIGWPRPVYSKAARLRQSGIRNVNYSLGNEGDSVFMSSALRYQKIGKIIVYKNYRFVVLIF